MKKNYFDTPAQVRFWDNGSYASGIAFGDTVICACCGGIMSLEEIHECADEDGVEPIYEYKVWESIDESIIGGDIEDEIKAGYFKE